MHDGENITKNFCWFPHRFEIPPPLGSASSFLFRVIGFFKGKMILFSLLRILAVQTPHTPQSPFLEKQKYKNSKLQRII